MKTAAFTSLSDFFHMGGYGSYVWPAYGVVALVLIWQWWRSCRPCTRVDVRSGDRSLHSEGHG